MKRFYYFIGEPGVGKTTLVSALIGERSGYAMREPVPHIVYGDGGIAQIGVARDQFGGTDGLAMNIQPKVVEWLNQQPYSTIFAEGDRLANGKFFRAVEDAGYALRVIVVEAGAAVAADRRAARAAALGKAQNETWLKGRQSKVLTLAREFRGKTHHVLNNLPPVVAVQDLRAADCDPFAGGASA